MRGKVEEIIPHHMYTMGTAKFDHAPHLEGTSLTSIQSKTFI